MNINRRGDIGFAEAMTGTAAVCVVLGVFTVFAVTMVTGTAWEQDDFDWTVTNGVSVMDGVITWDGFDECEMYIENNHLKGLIVTADPKVESIEKVTWTFGEETGENLNWHKLVLLESDDGRRVPVELTVTGCS